MLAGPTAGYRLYAQMSASISYASLHPAISHLSIEQICEMHVRFMNGASVQSLLDAYQIETDRKQLMPLLPLRILNDQPCPCCSTPMQQKWPTRSQGSQPPFCKPCGHEHISRCNCGYCHRQRLQKANREWAARRFPYSKLGLRHKILLAALLLTAEDEIAGIKRTGNIGPFAPGMRSSETFIAELWNAGIIVLARAPAWVISNHRSEWVFMPEGYGWSNNVSAQAGDEAALSAFELLDLLFSDLDLSLQVTDEPVLVAMIRELAQEAAYAYIDEEMYKANLQLSCEAATLKVIRTLLETLALADICAIGWQAAKNCGRCYVENVAKNRRHAANILPGQMSRIAEARLLKPDAWKVDRPIGRVSRVERVLHDVIFGGQDEFFSWPLDVYVLEVVGPRLKSGRRVVWG